jgi:diacylglycerol kinase family enzyme
MPAPTSLESLERLADAAALTTPAEARRMLVIVNPYATTVSDRLKNLVVYALRGRYEVDAVDTESKEHATQLCREAADEGYDVVVAFGGDGTVNEAANGLAGSKTALSVLPGGATNVYCRVLGIPPEIVDATEHLLRLADEWDPRVVDLGRVNGRCFTFTAGLGLDASVVERVDRHPHLKARLGAYYFTYAAVTTFMRRYLVDAPKVEVSAGDETWRGVTAIVQNVEPYTYFNARPIEVAEGVAIDDGSLAGAVLERANPIDMPFVAYRALGKRARVVKSRKVASFAGLTELHARSVDGRPIPLQVDGDHIGDVVEAHYDVWPGALRVVA